MPVMSWVIIGPAFPHRGGIAHFTTALTNAAREVGDVKLINFSRLYPGLLYPGGSTHDPSLDPRIVDSQVLIDSINPITWLRTANRIAMMKPDLVILQWWTTFLAPCFGIIAARLRRHEIPVIFIIHNVLPHEPGLLDRLLSGWVLGQASGLIVLSELEHARLHKLFPAITQNTAVLPHPAYTHMPKSELSKAAARSQLNLPQDAEIILFFGFVRGYKGIRILLESMAELKSAQRTAYLLVAGEVWAKIEDLRHEVRELGIADIVRFENRYIPDEEVPVYFSASDVFVAPYTRGTQSGSLRLALSQGIPMVISEHLGKDLEHAENDLLTTVPAGDAVALSKGIVQQLERSREGETASLDASRFASWGDLVRGIQELVVGSRD